MEESSAPTETAPVTFDNLPYMTRVDDLNIDEAVEILLNPDMSRVSTTPAALPRAGDVYVYIMETYAKADITRVRSDGYSWYSCSGKIVRAKATGLRVQKYYWTFQNSNETGDHRFKRQEFRLAHEQEATGERGRQGSFVLVMHYMGDEKVATEAPEELNGAQATLVRSKLRPSPSRFGQRNLPANSSSMAAVTVVSSDGHESIAAVNSISGLEDKTGSSVRFPRRFETVSATPTTPMSIRRATFRSQAPPLKREWPSVTYGDEPGPSKLSKNHLIGQQVEATLDALEGEDLFAARDEIYDFLRKWDKD